MAAMSVAWVHGTRERYMLFFTLLVTHLGTSILYYWYVQTAPADTSLYYQEAEVFRRWDFALGTAFLGKLVLFLRDTIGGSYLDYFLLFQSFGFWGLIFLMRTFEEIHLELGMRQTTVSLWLLFLPGLHFWTSAIGKDAPLFLGVSLAVWSVMRLRSRYLAFAIAVAIMLLFRPHIALIAVGGLAIAQLFEPRSNLLAKIGLLAVAAVAVGVIAGTLKSAIDVNLSGGAGALEAVVSKRDMMAQSTGSASLSSAPYPVRVLSFLFRPLFFDAKGVFGIIASLENVFVLFAVGYLVTYLRQAMYLARNVYFLRYCLIVAGLLTLLLSFVFYNVGLALRQKMMLMPALLTFFVAHFSLRKRWREEMKLARIAERREEAANASPASPDFA